MSDACFRWWGGGCWLAATKLNGMQTGVVIASRYMQHVMSHFHFLETV
jgi:hypothetical protein